MLTLDSNLLISICLHLNDYDVMCLILTCSKMTKKVNTEFLWINRIIQFYNNEIGPIEEIRKYKPTDISWRSYYKQIKLYLSPEQKVFKNYNTSAGLSNLLKTNRLDIIKLLINRNKILASGKIRIENKLLTILEVACTYGYLDMAKYILQEGVSPIVNNSSVIGIASDKGHLKLVKLLLEWVGPNGEIIDPRCNMNYALVYACRNNHSDIVKYLLSWKGPNDEYIDPRFINNTPYAFSKIFKRDKIIEILLNWKGQNGECVVQKYDEELMVWPSLVTHYFPYPD